MSRFSRRLLTMTCGIALVAVVAVRPHLVERWALYLGSASAPHAAHLYLDPFPDVASCESRVRVFTANEESAFCLGHREIAFGTAADAMLALDFRNISGFGAWCAPRRYPRRFRLASTRVAARDSPNTTR